MKKYFPFIILTFAVVILFSPLLFSSRVVFWGTPSLQFVPWLAFTWESIFSGEMPLWNPYNGMGAPLIANYQSAVFYPLNLVYGLGYALNGAAGIAQTVELVLVTHILISGFGMIAFLRRLGTGPLAQAIGALAFALSGYVISRASFLSMNAVLAWLPWVMALSTDLVFKTEKRRSMFWLSLVVGLQLLAGHAQLSWYTLLLAGTWVIFLSWKTGNDRQSTWGAFIQAAFQNGWRFAAAYLIGVAIAAVQLIPTAEYLLQSQRASAVEIEYALNYSFWPWRFLTIFAPDMFGNPVRGDFWGSANYWEDAVYIGLLPALIVLGLLIRYVFRHRRMVVNYQQAEDLQRENGLLQISRMPLIGFLLAVTLVSFVLALGKNTPVFPFLYRYIPTFDMFQGPTRLSILAVFAMVVLASIGIEQWRSPTGRTLYWTRLGLMGSIAITIGLILGWLLLTDVKVTYIRAMAMMSVFATGFCIIRLTTPADDWIGTDSHWLWKSAAAGLLAIDLVVAGWGLIPAMDIDYYRDNIAWAEDIRDQIEDGRLYIPEDDEIEIKYQRFFEFDSFTSDSSWLEMRHIALPNANLLDRTPVANNYDPFVPGKYQSWIEQLDDLPFERQNLWYNLMNISLLEQVSPSGERGVQLRPVETAGRARYLPCVIGVDNGDDALKLMVTGEADLSEVILVERAVSEDSDCAGRTRNVELISQTNNRLTVHVEAGPPGYIMFSDVWYPGWKATVNGQDVEIVRADYLFRAVKIKETKEVEIQFEYRPKSFTFGLVISIAAYIGLIIYYLASRRIAWIKKNYEKG